MNVIFVDFSREKSLNNPPMDSNGCESSTCQVNSAQLFVAAVKFFDANIYHFCQLCVHCEKLDCLFLFKQETSYLLVYAVMVLRKYGYPFGCRPFRLTSMKGR